MPVTRADSASGSRPAAPSPRHRAVCATLLFAILPATISAADDPKEIVRHAIEIMDHESDLVKQYTYLERNEERHLDGAGAVKSRDSRTWDVTNLEGRQFRRLVQHNDKPLTAKEEAEQEARRRRNAEARRKTTEQRAKETPEQRQKRLDARERARKQEHDQDMDVVNSFDYRLLPDERIAGAPVWVVDCVPHKGYKFQFKDVSFAGKLQGRMWISKSDYQPVRIDAESTDTISFGAVLARIQKGARIHVEYTRVNDEVWLPKQFSVRASARILLVKGFREEDEMTYSNYKKFSAESRMVEDKQ